MDTGGNNDPRRRALILRLGIAGVVVAVVAAMWAGVAISINQSREGAIKDLSLEATNLALAFDEQVTRTLDAITGTMDAVGNRMAAKNSDMNLYAWSRQFPIVISPIVEACEPAVRWKVWRSPPGRSHSSWIPSAT